MPLFTPRDKTLRSYQDTNFGTRPVVAGELYGVRAFRVTAEGELQAPLQGDLFLPGVNSAGCQRQITRRMVQEAEARAAETGDPRHAEVAQELASLMKALFPEGLPEEHRPGSLGCTCGFYAYTSPRENDYLGLPRTVEAVVAGSGRLTAGEKGFRAERLRLVALIREGKTPWYFFKRSFPGVALAGFMGVLFSFFLLLDTFNLVVSLQTGGNWGLSLFTVVLLLLSFWGFPCYHWWRTRKDQIPWALLEERYQVPVYRSRKKALRAFPLQTPGK